MSLHKSALVALCAGVAFAAAGCSKKEEAPAAPASAPTPAVAVTVPEGWTVEVEGAENPDAVVVNEVPSEETPAAEGAEAPVAEEAPAAETVEAVAPAVAAPVVATPAPAATTPAPAPAAAAPAATPADGSLQCEHGVVTEVETNNAGAVVARTQRCRVAPRS